METDVLELGCGFGRVAIPLARAGYRVTGVDGQRPYLARARDRAAREGLALDLHHANIAEARFERAFDAVLCVFNSFGYFADPAADRRVLDHAWAALRPGGQFLLEVAHRDGVVRTMHTRDAEEGERHFREEACLDPVSGVLSTAGRPRSIAT